MKIVRLHNPASHLLLANPSRKGRKNMARKTRRKAASPARKRHNPAARKVHRYSAKGRSNPLFARRRHHARRRHSNPTLDAGLIKDAFVTVIGGALTKFVRPMVPIGQGSPYLNAGVTLGVGYLLGVAARKLGFGAYSKQIAVGGAVVAVTDLLPSVFPMAGSILGVAAPVPVKKAGMGDVVTLRPGTYDGYYGSTPVFSTPTPAGPGLQGVVTMRRAY